MPQSNQLPGGRYRILVVGAGPAGLTAATAFVREGHEVTVLERHPRLQPPGGPLTIQSAASKCLFHVGAKEILQEKSVPMNHAKWWSYKEDEPMASVPYVSRSETPRHRVNRPLIQRIMYAVAVRAGVRVEFRRNVVRLEEDGERVRLWTEDGAEWDGDLVVGADGVKSNVRRLIFPDTNVESIPTEECIFLTQVPAKILENDARVRPLLSPEAFQVTMGPGRFHVTSLHTSGRYAMTLTVMNYGPPGAVDGNWNRPADLAELRELFKEFNEPTRAYLEHVESSEMWQVAYGRHLDSWHSAGGRVVLIGDAAHAMLPHRAMGLSQGIEDAGALGELLRWAPQKGIPFVTECYEKVRRPRVEKIAAASLANAGRNALPDGPEQVQRDSSVRKMSGGSSSSKDDWDKVVPNSEAPVRSPEYEKWENDYDVIEEIHRFMTHLGLPLAENK